MFEMTFMVVGLGLFVGSLVKLNKLFIFQPIPVRPLLPERLRSNRRLG